MTPRSLFNIILKIFGLFLIRELINSTLQTVSSMIVYFSSFEGGQMMTAVVVSVAIVALYASIITQLLFKTNSVIDFLKLDQGFEEHELSFNEESRFSLHLSSATIINIALIVIGGVILVDEIPNVCRNLYLYFSVRNDNYSASQPAMESVVYSGVKILIALLLIGERNRIAGFIENRKKTVDDEEEPMETPNP